jgi:hypothetical protein
MNARKAAIPFGSFWPLKVESLLVISGVIAMGMSE